MFKVSSDLIFKTILKTVGVLMLLLLAGIFVTLVVDSLPAMKATGFTFFTGTTWDPVFKEYGSLVFLVGTLLTSFLALAISLPFSLAIAIFLGEYFREGIVSSFLKSAVELMAGIPSVIFGMWGLFVLVPLVRQVEMQFGVIPYGIGILTACPHPCGDDYPLLGFNQQRCGEPRAGRSQRGCSVARGHAL